MMEIFIIATNKTIKKNNTYLLIVHSIRKKSKIYAVKLMDVFFGDDTVNLIVRDMLTQKKYTINHDTECPEKPCQWLLIDLDYCKPYILLWFGINI